MSDDPRLHWPAAERNREPILEVLVEVLPERGVVLEIASGTGQHAVHFAGGLPELDWQPSEREAHLRASISAHREEADLPNLREPLHLDVTAADWPLERADAMVCINMVHISPWEATLALLDGAARLLPPGGPLVLYGPYLIEGQPTTESNAAFDRSLRERNPTWGLRDLAVMREEAGGRGLDYVEHRPMPANNFTLVFRR